MDREDTAAGRAPVVVWAYGALGLVPFAGGAIATLVVGEPMRGLVQTGLLAYGGLILAFLGGGRWGMEVGRGRVRPGVIGAAMAGSIVSTLLVAAVGVPPGWRLVLMALAHGGQWGWDVSTVKTPVWYRPVRHVLTLGAVLCLSAGAAASLL